MGVPTSWGERLETHYPGGRESIQRLGDKAGKNFDFSVQLSDTMDSWRLAMWAENQGNGEKLLSVIGRQYFEEAKPLADHAALLDAVEEAGLNRSEAKEVLESDQHLDEVMGHYRWALEVAGIRSIPVFMISDFENKFKTVVHGSSSTREFEDVLRKAATALVA
mmetsp:Transcript_87558/g.183166  ORF Transcript_87558/g.183166 Transcript_87558/m.183166 type:complete len:164 (+) Transcript_87558:393-884(+)